MRATFAYALSATLHGSALWLIAAADDTWLADYAVRSGQSGPGLSQGAVARAVTIEFDSDIDFDAAPQVVVELLPQPESAVPALPVTPANAEHRPVAAIPVTARERRGIGPRSTPIDALLPEMVAEFTPKVASTSLPELSVDALPFEPVSEQLLTTPAPTQAVAGATRGPAPSTPVLESGNADRNALASNAAAGAQVDHLPRGLPVNREPVYPDELRRLRIGGTVLLRVAITPTGAVETAALEKTSGHAALDASALAAVKDWHFQPARRGGVPVRFVALLPITFAIRGTSTLQ
jgi:protein TonB